MTEPMSYVDAILALRRIDDLRNNTPDPTDIDVDDEVTKILDRIPEILVALDPSRTLTRLRDVSEDNENDLMTIAARDAFGVGWQSCLAFNKHHSTDLYGGDVIAMVVQRTLAAARVDSPLTPKREWEIIQGPGAFRPSMVEELYRALQYERAFFGPMRPEERQEWRKRQDRLETERNDAETERDAAKKGAAT